MKKRLLTGMLCLVLLVASIPWTGLVLAATVTTGTVRVDDLLSVRSGPGTNYDRIGYLYNGNVVTIHETIGGWYRITASGLSGYVSADYVTLNASYETEEEFEAYLTSEGFPESYKQGLRQIHVSYPNWVFRANHLSMTWEKALYEETAHVGRNTLTGPEAWLSMDYGAYNWSTGEYVEYDTGGWCTASKAVTAYYMDPRNWLDNNYIFQFEELSYNANHTISGVQAILPSELDKHAQDLLNASRESGISAYHFATRITQEGTARNGLALGTVPGYEGYYNFTNIGAYAHSGNSAVTNGAIYAKNAGWDTPYKALVGCANMLGSNYIKLGQDTGYYQKFNMVNTTSGLYTHQYMTNVAAAASEASIRSGRATEEERSSAIVFDIPVYRDMPETVAPRPSRNGNNNNFLEGISVEGYDLTPSFDRYHSEYALHVGENVTHVNLDARKSDGNAAVSGLGRIAISPGSNELNIVVTATSGEQRVYTVTVTRPGSSENTPSITGSTYRVDSTVTGVEPDTSVSTFVDRLAVRGGTAVVHTAAGGEKTAGLVGTGDILRLYSGDSLYASYPIVIYGDVNGDGRITSLDLRIAQKHILGVSSLSGYMSTAADVNRDGRVSSLDLRVTQKFILGLTNSVQ